MKPRHLRREEAEVCSSVVSQICRVCVLAPTCLREAIYSRQGCVCDGSNRGGRRGIEARGGKRDANVTGELSLTPG